MSRPKLFSRVDRLRVRLRRSADPKPKGGRLKLPKAAGVATHGHTVRGSLLKPSPRWHQRVTVKIKYRERFGTGPSADKSYARALARQVAYNTRKDAKAKSEGVEPVPAFNARRVNIDAVEAVRGWTEDRRYWKLILSPERGNDMTDFLGYVRGVMAAVEKDVLTAEELKAGQRLEWVAAIHNDTDHRHAHVLLRGRVGDRDLSFNKAYLSHGIRARAAELATERLGYRLANTGLSSVPDPEVLVEKERQKEVDLEDVIDRAGADWGLE